MPQSFIKGLPWLGQRTSPIALLTMGASIYERMRTLKCQTSWRAAVLSCVIRLGILPAAFLMLAYFTLVDS